MSACRKIAYNLTSIPIAIGSVFDKGYRYGFNTQEKGEEIAKGHYTAEYWEYDSRLGRRWNLDPVSQISFCEYSFLRNNPNFFIDIKSDEFDESSQKILDNYKLKIKNKIEVLQDYKKSLLKLMVDGSDNKAYWDGIDQVNKAINELNTQLTEIIEMEKSKTIFSIDEKNDILRWYFNGGAMPKRKHYKKYLGKTISKYINEAQNKYEVVF